MEPSMGQSATSQIKQPKVQIEKVIVKKPENIDQSIQTRPLMTYVKEIKYPDLRYQLHTVCIAKIHTISQNVFLYLVGKKIL